MRARSSAAKSTTPDPEIQSPAVKEPEPKKPDPKKPEPPVDPIPDPPEDRRRASETVEIPSDYEPIVSTIFSVEAPETLYEQVEAAIRPIRASRADYGTIVDALDRAQEVSRIAVQLLVHAKATAQAFERDTEAVLSGFRDAALSALEAEKERGERKKAITEADVTARIAGSFPEDWNEIERNRSKIKGMIYYLEELAERARERARDLRAMVSKARTD